MHKCQLPIIIVFAFRNSAHNTQSSSTKRTINPIFPSIMGRYTFFYDFLSTDIINHVEVLKAMMKLDSQDDSFLVPTLFHLPEIMARGNLYRGTIFHTVQIAARTFVDWWKFTSWWKICAGTTLISTSVRFWIPKPPTSVRQSFRWSFRSFCLHP